MTNNNKHNEWQNKISHNINIITQKYQKCNQHEMKQKHNWWFNVYQLPVTRQRISQDYWHWLLWQGAALQKLEMTSHRSPLRVSPAKLRTAFLSSIGLLARHTATNLSRQSMLPNKASSECSRGKRDSHLILGGWLSLAVTSGTITIPKLTTKIAMAIFYIDLEVV